MTRWSRPFRSRDKLRPTSAIAFCAAAAVSLTPPAELHVLRSLTNDFSQITLVHLIKALKSLQIDDPLFAEALFEIADVHNAGHVKSHHLLIFYSLLRRVAFAPSAALKLALQEIIYFIFTSAAGSEGATHLGWIQWHRFASKLGHTIGGSDSLPSEEAEYLLNKVWPRRSIMHSPSLSFRAFVRVLKQYDSGIVLKLRAMGYLLTTCVIEQAHTHTAMPQWDVPVEDCRVLSQFLTHSISLRAQAGDSTQLSELRSSFGEVSIPGVADSQQDFMETKTESDRMTSPSASDPQLSPPEDSVLADRKRTPDIRPKTFSYPLAGSHFKNLAIAAPNGTCKPSAVVSRSIGASSKKSPFHIDYSALTIGEKIGSGACGDVYKGTFLKSPVAVKMFHVNISARANGCGEGDKGGSPAQLSRMSTMSKLQRFASINSQNKYHDFVREVEMMSLVRHPNLVLYMGVCGDPLSPLCIVCELFNGGSLYEYLHAESSFCPSTREATQIALGIARGMFYLHSSEPSILHRDLKSRNVLVSERSAKEGAPHVVICDFGLCQLFGHDGEHMMGTASYMSPNVILGEGYGKQDDTYSFGVLLCEIFTGRVPFEGMGATQVMFQVANSGLRPSRDGDQAIPERIARLIERCWDEEKKRRPLFDDVISELELFEGELASMVVTENSGGGEAVSTCNVNETQLDSLNVTLSSVSAGDA